MNTLLRKDFPQNAQDAKGLACEIVWKLIQQYRDSGQPFEDARQAGFSMDVAAPLDGAFMQLQREMMRRSNRWAEKRERLS